MRTPTVANDRGVALLIVLITITLLTIVVVEFTQSAEVATHFALSARNGLQAYYLARSGINAAEALIAVDGQLKGLEQVAGVPKGLGDSDSELDVWAKPLPPLPLGDGTVVFRVQDEARRLNLNMLSAKATGPVGIRERVRIFQLLFAGLGIDPRIVSAIVDWIDEDSAEYPDPPGVEAPYYLALRPPVYIRNAPMLTLGELRQIRGMTPAWFDRLQSVVTVLPVAAVKVNVNTAPPEVLYAMLDPEHGDRSVVDQVLAIRAEQPFTSPNDVESAVPGWGKAMGANKDFFDTKSAYFRIDAIGQVNDVTRGIFAVVKRDTTGFRPKLTRTYWGPSTANLSLTSQPGSDFLEPTPPLGGRT